MTRVLAIVVTLLALGSVFATAGAHAAPVAMVVVQAAPAADSCAEPRIEIRYMVKVCAKRHAAGLPCAPVPVILPPLMGAFGQVQPPVEIASIVEGGRLDAQWDRLYRPPRSALA